MRKAEKIPSLGFSSRVSLLGGRLCFPQVLPFFFHVAEEEAAK